MKKHFIIILSILIILVIGVVIYININSNPFNTGKETSSDEITSIPTKTPTPTVPPQPTATITPTAGASLFPAYQLVNQVRQYGYVNPSGIFAIQPEFEEASDFRDGVAVVYIHNQYCAINEKGEVIYTSSGALEDFSNGMAVISVNKDTDILYGYINTEGKVIIEPQFKNAYAFQKNNTATVYQGNGVYSIIDKTGTILESYTLEEKYDNPWGLHDNYIIYFDIETSRYGVIDIKGSSIFDPIYSEITYLGDGIFAMKAPNLEYIEEVMMAPAALFNYEGRQLTDYSFYDLTAFHEGFASATDESSTFFIDTKGRKAMELPTFEGRGSMTLYGDYIKAEIDNDLFYYTKNGSGFWKVDHDVYLTKDITVKQEKFKANRYILVYYPQVEGLKNEVIQTSINQQLKGIFVDVRSILTEQDAYLSTEDSFNASIIGNLLIIEKLGYDYYFGAAHGMPIKEYYYININTGHFYQLADLFLEGSDYAGKINELIHMEITAQQESENSMLFEDAFQGIDETPRFRLLEDSIGIYFYPYDIAAYAAGFPEFIIPFADLEEYLNKEGDFWKSFH